MPGPAEALEHHLLLSLAALSTPRGVRSPSAPNPTRSLARSLAYPPRTARPARPARPALRNAPPAPRQQVGGAGCTGPLTVRSAQAPHTTRRTQHAQGAREAHDACGAAKALAIQRHMSKTKPLTNSRILYCIMLHFKIIHFHIFHNLISNFSGSSGRVCSSWKGVES